MKNGFKKIIFSGLYETTEEDISSACLTTSARDFTRAGFDTCIAAEATNCFIQTRYNAPLPLAKRRALHQFYRLPEIKITPIDALLREFGSSAAPLVSWPIGNIPLPVGIPGL